MFLIFRVRIFKSHVLISMIPSLIDFFTADSKQFGELVGTSNLFSLDVGKQGVRIV